MANDERPNNEGEIKGRKPANTTKKKDQVAISRPRRLVRKAVFPYLPLYLLDGMGLDLKALFGNIEE